MRFAHCSHRGLNLWAGSYGVSVSMRSANPGQLQRTWNFDPSISTECLVNGPLFQVRWRSHVFPSRRILLRLDPEPSAGGYQNRVGRRRADVGLSISARTPVLRRIARCADGSRACFAHGVAARRIALAGDSAAGGLTVALLNLLKERRDRGADALEIWPHMLDVWPVPPAVANEWVKPPPAPQERSDVQRFGYGVSAHHSAR
jgi:hypothetical protein